MVSFKDGSSSASDADIIRTQIVSLLEIMLVQVISLCTTVLINSLYLLFHWCIMILILCNREPTYKIISCDCWYIYLRTQRLWIEYALQMEYYTESLLDWVQERRSRKCLCGALTVTQEGIKTLKNTFYNKLEVILRRLKPENRCILQWYWSILHLH